MRVTCRHWERPRARLGEDFRRPTRPRFRATARGGRLGRDERFEIAIGLGDDEDFVGSGMNLHAQPTAACRDAPASGEVTAMGTVFASSTSLNLSSRARPETCSTRRVVTLHWNRVGNHPMHFDFETFDGRFDFFFRPEPDLAALFAPRIVHAFALDLQMHDRCLVRHGQQARVPSAN